MKMFKTNVPLALSLILLSLQSGCREVTSGQSSPNASTEVEEVVSEDALQSASFERPTEDTNSDNSVMRSFEDTDIEWEAYSGISGEWVRVDSGIGIIQIKDDLKLAALNVGEFNDLLDANVAQTCLSGGINDVALDNCYSFVEGDCPVWESEQGEPQLWVLYYPDHYVVYVHPDCNHQELPIEGEASN